MLPATELHPRFAADTAVRTAFLVIDTESIPDGRLLQAIKYPDLTPDEAIARARADARETSFSKSDFLPVTFQIPIAVCVLRVGADFSLQNVACLDAPLYRPREVVRKFWLGLSFYERAKLVTFNGRGFDLPLMELAGYRHGCNLSHYLQTNRNRYNGPLDLMEWFTNFGAYRMAGGLDLLAKLLGKPGKMDVSGDQVYEMYLEGRLQEINDYCTFDTLDTYFVFLRTRVMTGDISFEREAALVDEARVFVERQAQQRPALGRYLEGWGAPLV